MKSISLLIVLFGATLQSQNFPAADLDTFKSEFRPLMERYSADYGSVERKYSTDYSPSRTKALKSLYSSWLSRVEAVPFEPLSQNGKIDATLFRNHLRREIRNAEKQERNLAEVGSLIPFADIIFSLADSLREFRPVDPAKAATQVQQLLVAIQQSRKRIDSMDMAKSSIPKPKRTVANRAVRIVQSLKGTLTNWFEFYNTYDPSFTWWMQEPYQAATKALDEYATLVSEKLVGIKPDDKVTIIGDPIGRDALIQELAFEMIPYTPDELIAIANKEYAWCEAEMKKASREMGFGDDWKKALEYVKTLHVEPGEQPEMIRALAREAEQFVIDKDLVTVPQLARDSWRMDMMSPRRQLVNPFFTGGEVISVSFPTSTMTHEQKMMSMRGNNIHFSRATVHHELIPGHYLQQFNQERFRSYRQFLGTPFWWEGNSLYWEMLLWDLNFPKSPENKVGMLFWRMHRCARIIFSLSFHQEKMTPQECVDFLVEKVGHERDNASGEVRRSFAGDYSPLYQCAYMLGGLQFRALHAELVESGKMTNRQFHDAILKENAIPVELIRADLLNRPPAEDFVSSWRFYGEKPTGK